QKALNVVESQEQALTSSEKFLLRSSAMRDWALGNQRTVLLGLGVVLLAIAGLVYYGAEQKKANEKANTMLSRVSNYYASGDYRHAIDGDPNQKIQNESIVGLRQIVADYGSTPAGSQAALYLANSYYYLGKLDSAEKIFGKISIDYPLIKASVEAGRAAILEQRGNKEDAAKLFESAAKRDKNNPLNADYTLAAARDLHQVGKKDEAIRLYRSLLEDYPGSQFDDAAKRALIGLNVQL
ncbi:MAG: tetratricopeptide repeat protein, partial [Chthonomonadales bacterium]